MKLKSKIWFIVLFLYKDKFPHSSIFLFNYKSVIPKIIFQIRICFYLKL